MTRRWLDSLLVVAVSVLATALVLAPVLLELRLLGALVLFVGLPGHLLVQAVFNGPRPTVLERRLLALGSGYALAILFTLVLHGLVRPLQREQILISANLLNALLLLGALMRRADLRVPLTRPGWPVLLILAVAAPLRLINLGYSDFLGDEAKVVLRSMAVLQGMPDALIAHRKPPGEVLFNTAFTGALGTVTEQTVRLPFALAGALGVLAMYRLARALFGTRAGLVAALLLAVTGYFVAFGRILQYPSISLLLDALAVLCLYRFSRNAPDQTGYAVVGALLMASTGLMAFSAIFILPVAALALWPRLFGKARAPWPALAAWGWPLALLIPGAVLFYLLLPHDPDSSHNIESTFSVYLNYRLGGDRPYFNLESFIRSLSYYNSSLYVVVVLGGALLVLLEPFQEQFRDFVRRPQSTRAGRGSAASMWLALDGRNLSTALVFLAAVGMLLSSARRSLGWKLALVWAAGPLFMHLYLVRLVGTHWREMLPGLAMLLGAAVVGLYSRLPGPRARLAALLLGVAFLAANVHYVYVAWLQPWPEYQLTYPRYRHPLDWSNLNSPHGGSILGATRSHGWKAVRVLMSRGELPDQYGTNDRAEAAWYLKSVRICQPQTPLYIRPPSTLRDRQAIENGEAAAGFNLAGRVFVRGNPALALLVRQPVEGPPKEYHAEEYVAEFDRDFSSPWTPVGNLYWPLVNSEPECSGNR